MQMDVLNFGMPDTQARFTLSYEECQNLMAACAALREQKFPGILQKLPNMFDEEDLAGALGNEEQVAELMGVFELEQAFHQALHMFPQGHHHGHDDH